MAAGQRAGIEDDAVEDVLLRVGQQVLDLAEPLAVALVDGRPSRERQVRGRSAEVHQRHRTSSEGDFDG
jgi:hypothetical protein